MTILIANIGTSDIAVEISGHYIPIGFNRNEIVSASISRGSREKKSKQSAQSVIK